MKDNSTGKDKEFFERGKRMFERLNPPPVDWVETNNKVCKILRQVHDMLALASFPPKREWVGLTDDEMTDIVAETDWGEHLWQVVCLTKIIEARLKEKNT